MTAFEGVAQGVLDSLHEGCQVVSFDHRYLYVNESVVAQAKRSRDELVGKTMMECYPGIDQTPMFAKLDQCLKEREHLRMENEFDYPDGSRGCFELRFIPVPAGVCVLSLDVTEQKRTAAALAKSEEQLRHAQKMEAIGALAGGVAHDFNNLLTVILSCAELMLIDIEVEDPRREDVEEIRRAGRRAADLTRQLLTFSRREVSHPRTLDLNDVVRGLEKMLARLLGENVKIAHELDPSVGTVLSDPGLVEQVLMNLAVNARDAMPEGGMLSIRTKNVDLTERFAAEHVGVEPGGYVMLSVTDNGMGMDVATQARIFEPFFTTKAIGKGTGLGLATVFGIVKQSAGHIVVTSEPGRGTTFAIYFPRTEGVQASTVSDAPRSNSSRRGSETILLVEDDDQVRAVARGILRRQGYTVLEAAGPGEALIVTERQPAIGLLLTDVVLPLMSGPELAVRLRAIRPEMKVIFMSGYSDDIIGPSSGGAPFLQKPITPEDLTRKVRDVLGESTA